MKGGMDGNDDNFAALTAYVLIALMEAGLNTQVVSIIIQSFYILCCFLSLNSRIYFKNQLICSAFHWLGERSL